MALDVYFKDDIQNDLVSSVATFLVGQLSSRQPNIAAVKAVISFVVSHGLKYGIKHSVIRCEIATFLSDIGRDDIVSMLASIKLLTG